ncbi:hypothetical protein Pint_16792 [Pistacia integerrima]|uniref:Uncharacterized protein n=1 Tax=Pistacia integerrima TaxID=434235 RepID=A0ACC0ZF14_9ROSI|nr:hypothetical protein Pint_16792 [Pistacia integerrima]
MWYKINLQVLVDQDPGLTGNLLVERLVGAHIELISKEEYGKISVVCGGTIAGSVVGIMAGNIEGKEQQAKSLGVHAFAVCDDPDYFYDFTQGLLDGLNAGVNSHDIVNVLNGYAINTSEELNFVKEIAAATGVVLDPCLQLSPVNSFLGHSGKAAYGMLKDMAENPKKWEGRKILFIHTGGLLGLFDKVDQMAPLVKNWNRMDVHKSVPRQEGVGKMF